MFTAANILENTYHYFILLKTHIFYDLEQQHFSNLWHVRKRLTVHTHEIWRNYKYMEQNGGISHRAEQKHQDLSEYIQHDSSDRKVQDRQR